MRGRETSFEGGLQTPMLELAGLNGSLSNAGGECIDLTWDISTVVTICRVREKVPL